MMLPMCAFASDYTCTYIEGECVVEFGDYGKAPNQYVTEVGDLNVISPLISTRAKNGILINDSFVSSSNESSTSHRGSSAITAPQLPN